MKADESLARKVRWIVRQKIIFSYVHDSPSHIQDTHMTEDRKSYSLICEDQSVWSSSLEYLFSQPSPVASPFVVSCHNSFELAYFDGWKSSGVR